MKVTPEFTSYVRTDAGHLNYGRVAQALGCVRDSKQNSAYAPPVHPVEQSHHRAKRCKVAGPAGTSVNAFQQEVGQTLRDYTAGKVSQQALREKLAEYHVQVEAPLDKLLRRHEAGDFVTYNELGMQVFRQLNGTDLYDRVDKIALNNPKIVSPEKTGRPFTGVDAVPQMGRAAVDALHVEKQERHIGGSYVPKKRTAETKPGVHQLHSSFSLEFNPKQSVTSDTASQYSSASRGLTKLQRDQMGADIFQFKNLQVEPEKGGRRRLTEHKGHQDSRDMLYWSTRR